MGKEQIDVMEHIDERDGAAAGPRPAMITGSKPAPIPTILHDSAPVTVDLNEFQYTYRCRHCGHQWSEIHEKTDVTARPSEYTGD